MTPRQNDCLQFIKKFVHQNGRPPLFREIGDAMGLSSIATVYKHVHHLADEGYIALNKSRGSAQIELIPEKLSGFHFCDTNHELIYYLTNYCPMCRVLAAGAREVS